MPDPDNDDTVLTNGAGPDDDTIISEATLDDTTLGDTVLGASALRDSELDDTVLVQLAVVEADPESDEPEPTPAGSDTDTPFEETVLRGRRAADAAAAATVPVSSGLGAAPISYGIRQLPPQTPIARVDLAASLPHAVLPASSQEIRQAARKKAKRRGKLLIVAMVIATAAIATGVVYCVILLLNA
jgi:hypothetical protein